MTSAAFHSFTSFSEPSPHMPYVPYVFVGGGSQQEEGPSGTEITYHDHALSVTMVVAVVWFLLFCIKSCWRRR